MQLLLGLGRVFRKFLGCDQIFMLLNLSCYPIFDSLVNGWIDLTLDKRACIRNVVRVIELWRSHFRRIRVPWSIDSSNSTYRINKSLLSLVDHLLEAAESRQNVSKSWSGNIEVLDFLIFYHSLQYFKHSGKINTFYYLECHLPTVIWFLCISLEH